MEGRHVWALYLVKSRRGLGGSAPKFDEDDDDDFVTTRRSIGAYLIKV